MPVGRADKVQIIGQDGGDGTVAAVVAGVLTVSGGSGGGGAVTVADGADVTQGAIADAVVAAGAAGTLSAKLRRLTTDLAALLVQLPATLGAKVSASSLSVVLASDQARVPTSLNLSATGTASNVSGSATSVTVLASNANRVGATVYNDSSAILYLKLGATASTSSYTVQLPANAYYEVPARYTGIIDGIWASATGVARVTELT